MILKLDFTASTLNKLMFLILNCCHGLSFIIEFYQLDISER